MFGGNKGFSLLELLIAISLIAVGLLATATMLSSGIGSNRFAYMTTVETSITAGVVEEVLAKEPGDPLFASDTAGIVYDLDPDTASTTRTVQGRTYSATYSVDANNPVNGVARISVTVTSGPRSVSFVFLKSTA